MIELAVTEFTICYAEKGVGGGVSLHMLQMQLTYSKPELIKIWKMYPFTKQESKHPLISF